MLTKEQLKKRCGERNVDNRFQVQLKDDEDRSVRQSWIKINGLSGSDKS